MITIPSYEEGNGQVTNLPDFFNDALPSVIISCHSSVFAESQKIYAG